MLQTRSLRRRAAIATAGVAALCVGGLVLLHNSETSPDASAPCHETSGTPAAPDHTTAPKAIPPQSDDEGLAAGERLLTGRQGALVDARALARRDHVSVPVALARLRQQSGLDGVVSVLTARYPGTYGGSYVRQHPYGTIIRFCGPVPAGARQVVAAHHLAVHFDPTAVGSERALYRAADRVADVVASEARSMTVSSDITTDTIQVLLQEPPGPPMSASHHSEIETLARNTAGGFGVLISYTRHATAIAQ